MASIATVNVKLTVDATVLQFLREYHVGCIAAIDKASKSMEPFTESAEEAETTVDTELRV